MNIYIYIYTSIESYREHRSLIVRGHGIRSVIWLFFDNLTIHRSLRVSRSSLNVHLHSHGHTRVETHTFLHTIQGQLRVLRCTNIFFSTAYSTDEDTCRGRATVITVPLGYCWWHLHRIWYHHAFGLFVMWPDVKRTEIKIHTEVKLKWAFCVVKLDLSRTAGALDLQKYSRKLKKGIFL